MTRRAVVLACAALLIVSACSGDSDDNSSETTFATTTTSGSTDTTSEQTTTTTSEASEESTTTTEAEEETTTTSEETTTTVTPTTVDPGPTGLALHGGGLGPVEFGREVDTVLEYMQGIFGPPTSDSGWTDSFSQFGTCPGSEVRGVTYGSLEMLFGGPDNDRTFFSWAYYDHGSGDVFGLQTPLGIGLGSTDSEVAAAYPGAEFDDGDEIFPPSATLDGVWVTFDGDEVMYLGGGPGCGE